MKQVGQEVQALVAKRRGNKDQASFRFLLASSDARQIMGGAAGMRQSGCTVPIELLAPVNLSTYSAANRLKGEFHGLVGLQVQQQKA
jgi:hypothetical protein